MSLKIQKIFKITIKLIFFALLIFALIIILSALYITSFFMKKAQYKADYIVVFGSAVLPGPSPSFSMQDRVKTASELFKLELAEKLILSGAPSVYEKHEADLMRELATSYGVSESDILLDKNGYNTCKTIQKLDKSKSYIFVSNDFHLARIDLLARRFGIKDYQLHASKYYNGIYLKRNFFFLREIFAIWFYLLHFDNFCDSSLPGKKYFEDKALDIFYKLYID